MRPVPSVALEVPTRAVLPPQRGKQLIVPDAAINLGGAERVVELGELLRGRALLGAAAGPVLGNRNRDEGMRG